jgi:hypothetical protein
MKAAVGQPGSNSALDFLKKGVLAFKYTALSAIDYVALRTAECLPVRYSRAREWPSTLACKRTKDQL